MGLQALIAATASILGRLSPNNGAIVLQNCKFHVGYQTKDNVNQNMNTVYTAVSYTHLDVYKRQALINSPFCNLYVYQISSYNFDLSGWYKLFSQVMSWALFAQNSFLLFNVYGGSNVFPNLVLVYCDFSSKNEWKYFKQQKFSIRSFCQ